MLTSLAMGLGSALLFGYFAQRLGVSAIVGYLLAGATLGPHAAQLLPDRAMAEQFAEIGLILLLFGVGLRLHLRQLLSVWRVAVPGAIAQSTLATTCLAGILIALGQPLGQSVVIGLGVSIASTNVLVRVLAEQRDVHSPIGHLAIGWTVVEDLMTVAMLLLLPVFTETDHRVHSLVGTVIVSTGKIIGLFGVLAVLGVWIIPWALERIEATRSRELFTLAVLVLALGIAVGAAKAFDVSIALGAFFAGLAVGRSEFAARAANDALPMRDAFAVLFFVSIGMLFDPRKLVAAPTLIAAILGVTLIGKPVLIVGILRALGKPMSIALPVAVAGAQFGEFSFVLGSVARKLSLLDERAWQALLAASIVAIAVNPMLYRFARTRRALRVPSASSNERPALDARHCIVVGYGPVGRTVHRILVDAGMRVTIIELNLETVRKLRVEGIAAHYGDVLRAGTLEDAGIASAATFVLSADLEDAAEVVRNACTLNPDVRIIARCERLRDAAELRRAGAAVVAAGEAEVAVALAEAVVEEQGETNDEWFSERRAAIRRRLYGAMR